VNIHRPRLRKTPVALTIAGSDSGGGAGIQADLKTFAAMGVHGACVIACLTAQNPKHVLGIECCSPGMLRRQLEAVFEELPPAAAKTGMLFSAENIAVVAGFLKNRKAPLVVDPVMVSTSGSRLLGPGGLRVLVHKLLPLATLVTPNLSEAEVLSGTRITALEAMREAARIIHARFGCAVLVKGGHIVRSGQARDVFLDGKTNLVLSARFVKRTRTHGTGCVYSAAICAALARGMNLRQAIQAGKRFVTEAILNSYRTGKHHQLGVK